MKLRTLTYTALFAALTAAGAFIRIPLGVSSVTLQFLFTAMAGVLLGAKYGALSQAVYVALGLLGIVGPDWLANSSTALAGILMLTFWRTVGYAMMIYLSAMKGIPQDYYEAASIDGADKMHCFRFITLPMLAPTTLFLLVTTFISSMIF